MSIPNIPRVCLNCHKPFLARMSFIKKGRAKFCCRTCYFVFARRGEEDSVRLFWSKVNKNGPFPVDVKLGRCWDWMGSHTKENYGRMWFRLKKRSATHISWILAGRTLQQGLVLCHKCDRPICVNPNHLFAGTLADNNEDMRIKKRHVFGRRHWGAKLAETDVLEIRRESRNGTDRKTLAERFRVTTDTITCISRGRTWKHLNASSEN